MNPAPGHPEGFTVTAIPAAPLPTLLSEPLLGGTRAPYGTSGETAFEDWGRRGPGHDL